MLTKRKPDSWSTKVGVKIANAGLNALDSVNPGTAAKAIYRGAQAGVLGSYGLGAYAVYNLVTDVYRTLEMPKRGTAQDQIAKRLRGGAPNST